MFIAYLHLFCKLLVHAFTQTFLIMFSITFLIRIYVSYIREVNTLLDMLQFVAVFSHDFHFYVFELTLTSLILCL